MQQEHGEDVLRKLGLGQRSGAHRRDRVGAAPPRRSHEVALELRVRVAHERADGFRIFRVEDRGALRERVDQPRERAQLLDGRGIALDAGAPCREHRRQHLADREEVDPIPVDEPVEDLVHHLREELALVEAQHVGAEHRVLDAPPRAMHAPVRDAHDAVADVALVVRALVERS